VAGLDELRSQLDDAEHDRDLAGAELRDAENALWAAKRRREEAERRWLVACSKVTNIAAEGIRRIKGQG
jgi:hypothetical protein